MVAYNRVQRIAVSCPLVVQRINDHQYHSSRSELQMHNNPAFGLRRSCEWPFFSGFLNGTGFQT